MIQDGTSLTYLFGEKNCSTQPHNPDGRDAGDDQTIFLGDDTDIRRWTESPPQRDEREHHSYHFGSAHSAGCNFVFGDGATRLISYQIDSTIHRNLGNRADGSSHSQRDY
jgi:hypothetical protein